MGLKRTSILYVNNFAHPYLGGGEVHLMHLIRAALASGAEVHLVAAPGSGIAQQARDAGASVIERAFSAATTMQTARELRRIADQTGAAIVHGTGYYTNLLARLAGRGAVVNTVHTMADASARQSPGPGSWAAVRLRWAVDRLTTGPHVTVVADSKAIANSLSATGASARVIYNGVDPEALRSEATAGETPPQVVQAREAGGTVIGCISRLERVKGIADLIDAAALLAQSAPQARVLIAGSGPLATELEQQIQSQPGLADRVTLLGYVESAAAFIGGLDLFVLPSHSEGFNTTVLEAMALGVPVVATDVGGTREAIEHGVTGTLVAPHSPQSLAAALARVLGEPAAATRMAHAARERVDECCTVKHMTDQYLALYTELAAREAAL